MSKYDEIQNELQRHPRRWLVTGAAGFIGSHLVEQLLALGQTVTGLDNFATGHRHNLEDVRARVTAEQWACWQFIEGDICRLPDCRSACAGVDYVLHQAALGSVPRSVEDPVRAHLSNVDGFLHMLVAANDAKVKRFVYASSSAVYGDHPALPKFEENIGRPLSPYAATKAMNEQYAEVFHSCYGISSVGLRYFNVFGPRQDPEGAYAAVIPKWFATLLRGDSVQINGDGLTSRDFCYIDNVVQANLLAATAKAEGLPRVFNIACGARTTLLELHAQMWSIVRPNETPRPPTMAPERAADVRHSLADIGVARRYLGYIPSVDVRVGLERAWAWYRRVG